jgi:hypothetical protein
VNGVVWGGRRFTLRNRNSARVDYVLGELYWQCEVGETVAVRDYVSGRDVLSREEGQGEVHWSHSAPMTWQAIATGFGLPLDSPGAKVASAPGGTSLSQTSVVILVVLIVLIFCALGVCGAFGDDDDGNGGGVVGGGFRGGGVYYGGK